MRLIVYKGFDKEFLQNIPSPLIQNSIEEKTNIFKLDNDYEETIQMLILQKKKENTTYWITYEEFTLAYEYLTLRAREGKLIIDVVYNNIYPTAYPSTLSIDDETYENYMKSKDSLEKEKSFDEKLEILSKFYADIFKIDNIFYVSYHNYEMQYNGDINLVKKYYENNAIDIENTYECDYLVKIGDDIEEYLNYMKNILTSDYNKIAYTMYCNTMISNMLLETLKTLLKVKGKSKLYCFCGKYNANNELEEQFKNIATNILKKENFEFRNMRFYKNPTLNNEMEDISQSEIMQYIVNEAEKAYKGDVYRDIFITAPTGSGKSLIFQVPSIYLAEKYKKLIIIIEPLKGLMADQQNNLNKCGYKKARFLNSDIPTPAEREQIVQGVKNGDVDILYISPETLLSHSLEALVGDREIGLIIVDEAHIVTTWGVGFRPDYWYLGNYLYRMRREKAYSGKDKKVHKFPIFAFTATAVNGGKDDTVSDTVLSLYMNDPIIKIGTAKRDNIKFKINNYNVSSLDEYRFQKLEILQKRMEGWIENKDKTIVYCPYKSIAHYMYNGQREFTEFLKFKGHVGVYTSSFDFDKNAMMEKFKDGDIGVMYATKAFGMGIDIPDIQNVYHYAVTGNLSDFIQEIGRAARKREMIGNSIIDYFNYDMKYMNSLFGITQIRQYQVKKCLEIIYDTYKSKNKGTFLINPKMFQSVFGKEDDITEVERRLKIVLLMLEKDLYEKYQNRILIARPSPMFTKTYVVIDNNKKHEILNGTYGKYFKIIANARIGEIEKVSDSKRYGNVYVSDIGDIYEIDLKSIWEDIYCEQMSFAAFKFNFYNKTKDILGEIRNDISTRVKLKVHSKRGKLNELQKIAEEEINYLTDVLSSFGRTYFSKEEFESLIKQRYTNKAMAEIIANTYLDIIDYKNICIKHRTSNEGDTKYQISDGRLRQLALSVLTGSSLMRRLNASSGEEYQQFYNESDKDDNLLKLLSIFNLITYEIEGGNTPEIFIRLTAPDRIRKIVEGKLFYTNDYVEKAKNKHYRAVKILDYFFKNFGDDNEKRWDFVEKYFLGEDVESQIDEIINIDKTEKIVMDEPIEKYINESGKTYQVSDYGTWDNIINNVVEEEKYRYFCNLLKNNNKRIPDYAYTEIIINRTVIQSLFIFLEEKVIVVPENYTYNEWKKCKEKNWNIVSVSDIMQVMYLIKGD